MTPILQAIVILSLGYVIVRMDWKWLIFKPKPKTTADPLYDVKRNEL